MKKLFVVLLIVVMLSTIFSVPSSALRDPYLTPITSGDFAYIVLPDGTAEITDYKGLNDVVTVPEFIDGYMVTSIGEEAFGYNLYPEPLATDIAQTGESYYVNISEVIIPYTVTRIGDGAFYYCKNLTKVTVPFTVTYIGADAFYKTPWLENQNDGLVYINDVLYCYKGDMPENTKINVKYGTTQICAYAFRYYNNLTDISIPDTVKSIGKFAFYKCTGLKKAIIPDSVEAIGEYAFDGCKSIDELKLSSSLEKIEGCVFAECESITEVVIPSSVTEIWGSAFAYCKNLASITIPQTDIEISGGAFDGTLWYNNLPDGCVYINDILYDYKGFVPGDEKLVIRDGTTEICNRVCYENKNIKEVVIPSSVTKIGVEAFRYSGVETVVIRSTVKTLHLYAFSQGVRMYGEEGSAAEEYSKTPIFKVDFVYIGDVDMDKSVTVTDATEIQRITAQISKNYDRYAADYDGDNDITVMDATAIQRKLARL